MPEPPPLDPPPLLGAGLGVGGRGRGRRREDVGAGVGAGAGAVGAVYVGAGWAGAVYVGAGAVGVGAVGVGAVVTGVCGTVSCVTGTRCGGSALSRTAVRPPVPTDCSRTLSRVSATLAARAVETAAAVCAAPVVPGATPTEDLASTGFAVDAACAEPPPLRAPSATAPVPTATSASPAAASRSRRRRARVARSGSPSR